MNQISHIYVLNVKSFTDRRIFMEQQLARFGLQAEFIFDWDVEDITDEIDQQYFTGDILSLGQKSCALKHVEVLKKIVANQSQYNLVLEDDALFSADLMTGLQQVFAESDNFPGNKVIFIGSGGNFYTPKSQRKTGQHLYIGSRGRFTDSYIIDSDTAQQRLEWIASHKISVPMDNQFDQIDRALGIQIVWLEDPVVEQGSKNGLFNSALEAAPPKWLQKLSFGWEKIRRKYINQLWK